MFQFPEFAHLAVFSDFIGEGCPIRKSSDQILFANPRSLSQLITSFFASESLGIPHTPLITSFNDLPYQGFILVSFAYLTSWFSYVLARKMSNLYRLKTPTTYFSSTFFTTLSPICQ
jgi:hypothetical protein